MTIKECIWCTRWYRTVHSKIWQSAPNCEGFAKLQSHLVSLHILCRLFHLRREAISENDIFMKRCHIQEISTGNEPRKRFWSMRKCTELSKTGHNACKGRAPDLSSRFPVFHFYTKRPFDPSCRKQFWSFVTENARKFPRTFQYFFY